MNLSDLRAKWSITNVQAMSRVVREKESRQTDDAFTLINGGTHFSAPPWRHPWHGIPTTQGARASGAFQHLGTTWASLAQRYGIPDFSPPNQEAGFVGGLIDRGALEDVIAGRFEEAVAKLRKEWTSLPGAAESRGDWTMEKAKQVFLKYGGAVAGGPDPRPDIPDTSPTPLPTSPQTGANMPTALALFAPILGELIPQIKSILNPQSEVAKRNTALLETIGNIIVKQAGATNMQDAVEKMQADPAVKESVQKAVVTEPVVMQTLQITEVGGGIAGARQADLVTQQQEKPFYKASAVFWVSVLLLPIVYWLVGSIIVGGGAQRVVNAAGTYGQAASMWVIFFLSLFGDGWTGEARSGAFNLVIGLILGGICGVYYGISVTQQRQQQPPTTIKE